MEAYILQPTDRARVLEDEMVELFCDGRTMIFFAVCALESVSTVTDVPTEDGLQTALRFTGPDSLLGRRFAVYVPRRHPDYGALRAALRDTAQQETYRKRTCDHDGRGAH